MTGLTGTTAQPTNTANATAGQGGNPPSLRTLAQTADVHTLGLYLQSHPQDRHQLETELVKAKRSSDVSQLEETRKYELPHWQPYHKTGGPSYVMRPASDTTNTVANSGAWPALVKAGQVTPSEQRVIGRMANNEGRLDSVQSYDSETMTMGAMQKTINAGGTGELAKQVYDFSQSNPAKYQSLFVDKGWTVAHTGKGSSGSDYTMSFTDNGQALTPQQTRTFVKDQTSPDHWNRALDPLLQAGRDPDFQAAQIHDFKTRLDSAMATVPTGKSYAQPVSAYLTSEKGAALVLDESVNRPSHVAGTFGRALDDFYAANPKAARDPGQWTAAQRADYEPKIMQAYQSERLVSHMTDPAGRADQIVNQGSTLSDAPRSFVPSP